MGQDPSTLNASCAKTRAMATALVATVPRSPQRKAAAARTKEEEAKNQLAGVTTISVPTAQSRSTVDVMRVNVRSVPLPVRKANADAAACAKKTVVKTRAIAASGRGTIRNA